jgi:hypothetical protein
MLPVVSFTLLAASATVSLSLEPSLRCPNQSSLTERMARVGLSVLSSDPKAFAPASGGGRPGVVELLSAPTFEVSIKPTAGGLLLTTRRTSDGKVFERAVDLRGEDCPTVERLLVVLIHSWITAKMPVLSPNAVADGGAKR